MKITLFLATLVGSLAVSALVLEPRGIRDSLKCKSFCLLKTFHLTSAGDCVCHDKSVKLLPTENGPKICSVFCRSEAFHVDASHTCHCNGKVKSKSKPDNSQPKSGSLKKPTTTKKGSFLSKLLNKKKKKN
ncbi:hypothetical protein BDB01DRAFT_812554 [Pilobolus umbonatus]|nr:hypothetical protein BDB01DRAFT_812554 [Pilobolus umbonatus]